MATPSFLPASSKAKVRKMNGSFFEGELFVGVYIFLAQGLDVP